MGKPPTHLPSRFRIVSGLVTSWQVAQNSDRVAKTCRNPSCFGAAIGSAAIGRLKTLVRYASGSALRPGDISGPNRSGNAIACGDSRNAPPPTA